MRRSRTRLLLIAAATLTVFPLLPVLSAQAAGTLSMSKSAADAAPDFASQRYSDPWDYSNVEDLSTIPVYNGSGGSGAVYENGAFSANVTSGGYFNLVNTIPGSLPYGRDGRATPIDADQYTRLSVRMYSSKSDVAQVWWKTCADANTACYGAAQFATVAGWGTYDIGLTKLAGTSADWRGQIVGIRIDPVAASGGRVSLDWLRLYQPVAGNQVTIRRANGNGGGELLIDQDSNPNNGNETLLRKDGQTVRIAANGSATVDTSLLPQGTWWLGVRDSSGTIYPGGPFTVNGVPMPLVIDPDVTGGAEVHDVMGGSAWDFSEPSDITATYNVANASFSGGVLRGQNALPYPGDNQFYLAMPGEIDGTRFHRITFKASYDGPWGLEDAPGGGMLARFIWQVKGNPAAYQDLNDVLVTPGQNTVTVDLASNPPTAVIDGDTPTPIGWAGQLITMLRFDPNEDPGTARTWSVDDIRLTEDDRGSTGFNVKFQDNNYAPNTVADIYVDRGGKGLNRTQVVSGLIVSPGVNNFQWNRGNMPDGTYWVLVNIRRGTAASSSFSTGPVQISGAAPVTVQPPFGRVDSVRQAGADGVRITGWAIDPSYGSGSSPVHLYVDGKALPVNANLSRTDVGGAYGLGSNHGFDGTITGIGVGVHSVCAYAYRPAGSVSLGCSQLTLTGDSTGNLDAAQASNGGIKIMGWALDRSTASSINVHAYVDGRFAGAATAGINRSDVAGAFPGYGANHGYNFAVPASPGNHTVCLYAIDQVAPGNNPQLGCAAVAVQGAPFGSLDAASRSGGQISVAGWAIDPKTLSPSAVHVYVDGVGSAVSAASFQRGDVLNAFPGYYTSLQGYSITVAASNSPHTVCVYAVGSGGGTQLGCARV